MIKFYLVLKPKSRMGKSDRKELLAEFYHRSERIYIYLFNLKTKPFSFRRLVKSICALTNHEMTHYFLRSHRGNEKVKETICEKMEFENVKW